MTIYFDVGRRLPRNWFKRGLQKMSDILAFQEHLWYIIGSSIKLAKKKAKKAKSNIVFIIEKERESEDINYMIEWIRVQIKGTPEEEEGEYKDILKFYDPLNKIFDKKQFKNKTPDGFKAMFKSKVVDISTIEKMYEKGLDETGANTMQNKLLEMGILSDVKWVKD